MKGKKILTGIIAAGMIAGVAHAKTKDLTKFKMPNYTLDESSLVYENKSKDPLGYDAGSILKYSYDKDNDGNPEMIVMKYTGPTTVETEFACIDKNDDGTLDKIFLDYEGGTSKDLDGIYELEINFNKKYVKILGIAQELKPGILHLTRALGLDLDKKDPKIRHDYKMSEIGALFEPEEKSLEE